jgi:hypothetical protein
MIEIFTLLAIPLLCIAFSIGCSVFTAVMSVLAYERFGRTAGISTFIALAAAFFGLAALVISQAAR